MLIYITVIDPLKTELHLIYSVLNVLSLTHS
jgi:hypothetical protein